MIFLGILCVFLGICILIQFRNTLKKENLVNDLTAGVIKKNNELDTVRNLNTNLFRENTELKKRVATLSGTKKVRKP